MPFYNPIEKLRTFHWDQYITDTRNIQLASGLIVAICTIALAIICLSNPQFVALVAYYPPLCSLGLVGAVSLIIFIGASALSYCGLRKLKNNNTNDTHLKQLQTQKQLHTQDIPAPPEPLASIDEQPIEYIQEILIRPILAVSKEALKNLIIADAVKMGKKIDKNKLDQLDWAFAEAEELFGIFLGNPEIFVGEVLRYFGPTKKLPNITISWRRLISAYNSGDSELFEEIKEEYEAIIRSKNFTNLFDALQKESNTTILSKMPLLLEELFSLPDVEIKVIGKTVLERIFQAVVNNSTVVSALNKLKKRIHSDEFGQELDGFVKIALAEAHLPQEDYKIWCNELLKYMLQTTFKKRVCFFLSAFTRNIRLLSLLFDKSIDQSHFFVALQKTFLIAESSDCIKIEELQTDMFHVQSQLNLGRAESNRIALIVLKENAPIHYPTLIQSNAFIKLCFETTPSDIGYQELRELSSSPLVEGLTEKYRVNIIAVPSTISDHPLIVFKENEGKIKFAASLFKGFVPRAIKPKIMESLPKMQPDEYKRCNALVDVLIHLIINPIYDGCIGDTSFRPTFEHIITHQGEELAAQLDGLILDEDVTFEKIRDSCARAIQNLACAFEEVPEGQA